MNSNSNIDYCSVPKRNESETAQHSEKWSMKALHMAKYHFVYF